MKQLIVNHHSPYVSTHQVKADCTDVVVTLTVPLEIGGWKVNRLGIMGRIFSELYNPNIDIKMRDDIIKYEQYRYGLYINCLNENNEHISSDTKMQITIDQSLIVSTLYRDLCGYNEPNALSRPFLRPKNILEWFRLEQSIWILPGQTLNFWVMGYNHNPVNIERVEFRCGFDLYNQEDINVK
jgi:hypothetical protein